MHSFHRLVPVIPLLVCGFIAISCEEKPQEAPKRTEPWLRDEGKNAAEESRMFVDFRLATAQELELSLPARRAKPLGSLRGITGNLRFSPAELQFVSGHIDFDLQKLQMDERVGRDESPKTVDSKDSDKNSSVFAQQWGTWTEQAQNWLVLGKDVPASARDSQASYFIESARDLSHPRASAGANVQPEKDQSGFIRRVDATVVGRLQIKKLSVARTLPIRIHFFYDQAPQRDSIPQSIEVSLRGNFKVPLAEYEIEARDAAGHAITQYAAELSHFVGSNASIEGKLLFIPANEPSAKPL